jgi:excisionase family DNA binding protein
MKLLLRPIEAADALGISRTVVYELMSTGALETVKIGRSRRVPVTAQDYVTRLRTDDLADAPRLGH